MKMENRRCFLCRDQGVSCAELINGIRIKAVSISGSQPITVFESIDNCPIRINELLEIVPDEGKKIT